MNLQRLILNIGTAALLAFPAISNANLIDASTYTSVDAAFNAFLTSGTATGIYFPARTSPYIINSPPLSFGTYTPKSITLQGDSACGTTPSGSSTIGSHIRVSGTSSPGFSLSFSNYSQTFTMDSLELDTDYSGGSPVASHGALNIDYSSATGTASGTTVSITQSRFSFSSLNSGSAMVTLTAVKNATLGSDMFNADSLTSNSGVAIELLHGCNTVWITQCSVLYCSTGVDIDSSSGSLYAIYVVDTTFVSVGCGLNAHGSNGVTYLTFNEDHVDMRKAGGSDVVFANCNSVYITGNLLMIDNQGTTGWANTPHFALVSASSSSGVSICDNEILGVPAVSSIGKGDYIHAASLSTSYILRNVLYTVPGIASGTFYSDTTLPCYGNQIGYVESSLYFTPSSTLNIVGTSSPFSY